MSQYKTLRTWSLVLLFVGVFSVASAAFGVIAWAIQVDGFSAHQYVEWRDLRIEELGSPSQDLLLGCVVGGRK